jgi:hypothetical protein
VTYSMAGQSETNTYVVKVQQPTSLQGSTVNTPISCTVINAALIYTTSEAQITYSILEQDGTTITGANLPVFEQFTPISNTCSGVPATPVATSGSTNVNGVFGPDQLYMCSQSCMPANSNG